MGVTTYVRIKYHSADQTSTLSVRIIDKEQVEIWDGAHLYAFYAIGDRLSAQFRKT